ncbi:MAG: hypothetical protein ACLRSE_13060 [Alistipes finegoldii]
MLTKTETAVSGSGAGFAEEFTSEIEPYKQNDITPAASACISTGFWSRWAIPCVRVS